MSLFNLSLDLEKYKDSFLLVDDVQERYPFLAGSPFNWDRSCLLNLAANIFPNPRFHKSSRTFLVSEYWLLVMVQWYINACGNDLTSVKETLVLITSKEYQ